MASTHEVLIGDTRVTKRFRSWDRGEPDREWEGLQLLFVHAPGLAPDPISRHTDRGRPVIVMSRVEGFALGRAPLSAVQVHAVATAMDTLHTCVPLDHVTRLPSRLWGTAEAVEGLRESVAAPVPAGVREETRRALRAGAAWINSREAARFVDAAIAPVFAQADGNLANYIWNGRTCSLVDFEDSGQSDRALEIADLVEHVSAWLSGVLEAETLLRHLSLEPAFGQRVHLARRVWALFWLLMLLPGNPGHDRNPQGSVDRQACRLLDLLDQRPVG